VIPSNKAAFRPSGSRHRHSPPTHPHFARHFSVRMSTRACISAAGETPVPSHTTMSQANSVAAPSHHLSMVPGEKYFAKSSSGAHGVTFGIGAKCRPIAAIVSPGRSIDITGEVRGHANVVAIQWDRNSKSGSGTITVGTSEKALLSEHVTPHSRPTLRSPRRSLRRRPPSATGERAGSFRRKWLTGRLTLW
jgi:hypothetical protein